MEQNRKIMVIGCGNMGSSLIGGLIAAGHDPACLAGVDPDESQRQRVAAQFNVPTAAAPAAVHDMEAVVLAVKPQALPAALAQVGAALRGASPLLLSVAAGAPIAAIEKAFAGDPPPVVRAMPNMPALVGAGAAGLCAGNAVTPAQRRLATAVMEAVGVVVWLDDESLLDAVTAVSGSGPAYFFLLVELLEQIAVDMGLGREQSRALVVETAAGAARMLKEPGADAAVLRRQVTSPGGTTEQALRVFQEGGLEALLRRALEACRQRSVELALQAE